MATLVATPGAADANSYETLAEALAYFETRSAVPGWENADDQEVLLMMGTRVLDAMARPRKTFVPASANMAAHYITRRTWTGAPATSTQKLAWPRTGMYDANGNAIASNIIPQDLKDALSELAGALGTSDSTVDNDVIVQGLTSVKAGSVALTFKDMIERRVLPDMVWDLMPPSWFTDEVITPAWPALFDVVSE
jgi:hypothetical protein